MNRTVKEYLAVQYKISMFFKSINFKFLIIFILFFIIYLALYIWVDPSSQSLVAHDEGLYARRARLLEESNNWFIPPFEDAHHKTLGSYWLIALAIKFSGFSELSIRFPSFICSFISIILVFLITRELSNKRAGIISVIALISMPLWIQYSKYASPDMAFVTCSLTAIYSLIKAFSKSYSSRSIYLFLFSFSLSIGFFFRSYMIFIPCIALSPYLINNLKEDKINSFFALFLGFLIGFIPTSLNLYFAYKTHYIEGITSLFDFARKQAIGPSIIKDLYYMPLNFFYLTLPIGFIIILLYLFATPKNTINSPSLIYGYPLISTFILLSMSKTYAHYFLFLLPSLAIYFAIFIDSYAFKYSYSFKSIKYLLLFFLIIMTITISTSAFIYKYKFLDLSVEHLKYSLLISTLFIVSYLYSINNIIFKSFDKNLFKLFLLFTIPQLLGISLLYNLGVIGNPNSSLKKFISDKTLIEVSNTNKIYLLNLNSKTNTLLSYYLPSSKTIDSLILLPKNSYFITSDSNLSLELRSSKYYNLIKRSGNNYLFLNNLSFSD